MIPALEIDRLSFTYPDGTHALTDISLLVGPGECVGIIGANGAGKSTLLQHLNGLLPENPGKQSAIRIFDQPITAANLRSIRQQVGVLFQDPGDQLFCPTVFEDVAFGPQQFGLKKDEITARVSDALARVGLSGYEHRIAQHLSGGEKKRVCLAGVLACNPKILVLDEPTASLDPFGRREIKKLLREIPITKLIATHDLEMVVELCPRVIILDGGRIVAQGNTIQLLSNEKLMLQHRLETPHILQHLHPHGMIYMPEISLHPKFE